MEAKGLEVEKWRLEGGRSRVEVAEGGVGWSGWKVAKIEVERLKG